MKKRKLRVALTGYGIVVGYTTKERLSNGSIIEIQRTPLGLKLPHNTSAKVTNSVAGKMGTIYANPIS